MQAGRNSATKQISNTVLSRRSKGINLPRKDGAITVMVQFTNIIALKISGEYFS